MFFGYMQAYWRVYSAACGL